MFEKKMERERKEREEWYAVLYLMLKKKEQKKSRMGEYIKEEKGRLNSDKKCMNK